MDLPPSHAAYCAHRAKGTPPDANQTFFVMSTVINPQIAQLQQTALDLQATLETVHQTTAALTNQLTDIQDQIKVITEADEFDVFVRNELIPFFGESTSDQIVNMLQKCRLNGNNYIYFNPVYQWKTIYGDLQKRQLLKLVSAVYRVKYCKNGNNIYSLKSDIKYAKACPECGAIAATFYNRLSKEGLV